MALKPEEIAGKQAQGHPGLWAVSALAVVALAALAFRRKSGA